DPRRRAVRTTKPDHLDHGHDLTLPTPFHGTSRAEAWVMRVVRGGRYSVVMREDNVERCPRCSAPMEWRHGTWQCRNCRFKLGCCEGEPQTCDQPVRSG